MSAEITYIHELLAKFNAILWFAANNQRAGMDVNMAKSVRAISPAFVSCKAAIEDFGKAIEKAGAELKRHSAWPGLEVAAEQFEQMREEDVEALIRKNLEALNGNVAPRGQMKEENVVN